MVRGNKLTVLGVVIVSSVVKALDWLDSSTTDFVCTNCGYIFWFV